jgi:transcription elongation factor GreB
VSKAFTDEEAAEAPRVVAPRPPLPSGVPNYVTARGLARLHAELAALQAERAPEGPDRAALVQRLAQLEERIASAVPVPIPAEPPDDVRFGATVEVEGESGARRIRIVGVDEADAAHGRIAFVSPLARALLGRRVGDVVRLRLPRGDEELAITAIAYEAEAEEAT